MNPQTPTPAQELFVREITSLWPALKGSLAPVHKPCIRPACRVCARGDKHPAFILSFTEKGRRRCMYVPNRLVPLIQRALKNGRQIQELLYRLGPTLIREHRQTRQELKTSKPRPNSMKSVASSRKRTRKS